MLRRLWKSTFGLVLLASLALAVATLVLGVLVYLASHEALEVQLDQRIATETKALQVIAEHEGIANLTAAIVRREDGHRTSEMGYALLAPDGGRVAGHLDADVPHPGAHELLAFRDPVDGTPRIAQALVTALPGKHILVVAADRTPIDEIDSTIIKMFIATFSAMLAIGIGCAWMVGLTLRRRLDRINSTAEAIIDGDLSQRMARDQTGNEFDRLAETLNRMLDRNQGLLENLQRVSTDIAHDLRTPLARQKQALDAALAVEQNAESYRRAIQAAADAGQEILDLFAALLRISEIETFHVRDGFQQVDLNEVVERVADAFRASAELGGRRILVTRTGTATVPGDRHLLTQLLANLVENGLNHTPSGTTVTIALKREHHGPVLSVSDDGPGVAPDDFDRILQRFVRLDPSRSAPGHGLGMSLVVAIAHAHHAEVILSDCKPGFRVEIRFADAQE